MVTIITIVTKITLAWDITVFPRPEEEGMRKKRDLELKLTVLSHYI